MKNVCILARVSTLQQDYERQISELTQFADANNMNVVKIFANKISGATKNEDRTEIQELISYVKTNKVDKVLCLEISRLGRNTLEALKVIELLNQHKIPLYVKNYSLETIDEHGKVNPMAQLLITLLLEIGNMERTTIRQRMESGYKNHIANGGSVGRKIGYKKSDEEIKSQYTEEIKLLRKGYSLRNITKITGTSVNTLRKVKSIAV
ncbi:recombinase family protein [uncultured Draconibacterium sp.]|uniref:recombinase family protein n=1 Tax=uncultured Draconibacterium sp. TaxID=1573823 RepID=UPI0029C8AF39|nr:recombinase family protein [uncultured Draconibacterium sp.]